MNSLPPTVQQCYVIKRLYLNLCLNITRTPRPTETATRFLSNQRSNIMGLVWLCTWNDAQVDVIANTAQGKCKLANDTAAILRQLPRLLLLLLNLVMQRHRRWMECWCGCWWRHNQRQSIRACALCVNRKKKGAFISRFYGNNFKSILQ